VIKLDGCLGVQSDPRQLYQEIRASGRKGVGTLVLDLRSIGRLDCTGIGQLLHVHKLVIMTSRTLALVNVASRHKRLLEMAGLLQVFPVLEDSRRREREAREPYSATPCLTVVMPAR
jgi:anti-anti-sigma factor